MNIYPAQMRQIMAYCEALDATEEKIGFNIPDSMTVQLLITVTDEHGDCILGHIKDDIGGAWSFEGRP